MTYNILDGAVTGDVDQFSGITGVNRLPRVMDVIKAVNPDILGIEEANTWQVNGEAIAKQVAKDLGMNYTLRLAENGFNVALFTKFEIRKVYPCCILGNTSNGALHAELVTGTGREIQVYVVHLKNEPQDVTRLIKDMAPHLGQDTILMGDMNFTPYSAYAKQLTDAGWVFPMVINWGIIDEVWTSPSLAPSTWPELPLKSEITYGASDHNPFITRIGLYPSK
jgi:endonuclease/exonuclease/phosphatase family metal-dependent hydrolase